MTSPDTDGLPGFPPLPGPAGTAPGTGSLLRLVRTLDTAALEVAEERRRALVLFVDGSLHDGYLEDTGAGVVSSGPEVLDLLDGAAVSNARVYNLPAPVLRLLPCYWRVPTGARVGPTRWLNAEPLIRSFAHSGQRGVLCAFAGPGASGLVFLEQDAVVGAYTTRSAEVDGVEEIAPLLGDPRTMLFARLEGLSTPAEPAEPVEAAPLPEPLLDNIEQAIRAEIHEFAGPAVAVFRSAPQTRDGLLEAAQRVEHMRLRMISPDTMQVVAERARRIITEAS